MEVTFCNVPTPQYSDCLKTLSKFVLTPYLLDIFIVDKYKLVCTPTPPTKIWMTSQFIYEETVHIWQDSSVALWIKIAVIINWR